MKILLDNGHGIDTPGKRSPDGRLFEWQYTREIVKLIYNKLSSWGYDVEIIVPEDTDISLSGRCKRINSITEDSIVISVHCNAAGNEGWKSARGWQVCVSNNASSNSKILAECLFDSAKELGLKTRQPSQEQKYWIQNLAICRDTKFPAILTENLFQDNIDDVDFLLSEEGKQSIVDLHVNGILKYLKLKM